MPTISSAARPGWRVLHWRRALLRRGRVVLNHLGNLAQPHIDLGDSHGLLVGGPCDLRNDFAVFVTPPTISDRAFAVLLAMSVPADDFFMEPWINSVVSLAASALLAARVSTSSATTAKALSVLACPRGFDGGVQRQDIGLEGDVVDDFDDFEDIVWRSR